MGVEKRYQVFVSSTYEDLKEERAAVIDCLLDNNCIPVGMEQFPASSMSQWEYIQKMMEYTDYYVLITAGKYGSIDPSTENRISYTEREYDYAKGKNIPVLSFIIKNMDSLPGYKLERDSDLREKLTLFQNKVRTGKLVSFYSDVSDLKYEVSRSISRAIIDEPAIGWIRADSSISKTNPSQVDQKLAQLEAEIAKRPIFNTGRADPTSQNCPSGALYGQYK